MMHQPMRVTIVCNIEDTGQSVPFVQPDSGTFCLLVHNIVAQKSLHD